MFAWATDIARLIPENLCKDLQIIDKSEGKTKKGKKIPYTNSELKKLFESSPWYSTDLRQTLRHQAQNIFIPILALYTGAKPTELAQLYTSDIKLKTEYGVLNLL